MRLIFCPFNTHMESTNRRGGIPPRRQRLLNQITDSDSLKHGTKELAEMDQDSGFTDRAIRCDVREVMKILTRENTMGVPSLCGNSIFFFVFCSFFISLSLLQVSRAQQTYINNKQLACYDNQESFTKGFSCDGPQRSCDSYLTFRSSDVYDSPPDIASLLASETSKIAQLNGISDADKIPVDTVIIVPVNCYCAGDFYQHNSSYRLIQVSSSTYLTVANDTYQGLTTCQALMTANPYDSRKLSLGMELVVPLRCACPSVNQIAGGVRFLLTYLVTWRDTVSSIAKRWGVDEQSIKEANRLSFDSLIFPFTPLLVPLKSVPTKNNTSLSAPPEEPPKRPPIVPSQGKKSSKTRVFIAVGVGGAAVILVALTGFLFWFLRSRRPRRGKPVEQPQIKKLVDSAEYTAVIVPEKKSGLVSSEGVRGVVESLIVYSFEELERATGFFSEANRIRGSVYHGVIKGDDAAIKRMKGDVSKEVNILKQINHSKVIRLSGFSVHQGNTYLVYEFADNGSLSDWLHEKKHQDASSSSSLGWKQRVQIAYDVADGLNYLHNYTDPVCIHKDLKSSNILLDANLRAKIANFGLARTVVDEDEGGGLQMTKHVVGTQGYMAPEYLENGVVTPKMDVYAFGVVMLELLSGREAAAASSDDVNRGEYWLSVSIYQVLQGDNVREKLRRFLDPSLRQEYPLDLAYSMAQLAYNCVIHDLNSRPTMSEVFVSLSKILSSSLDWDPSVQLEYSRSLSHLR